jgi:hypothetical protein
MLRLQKKTVAHVQFLHPAAPLDGLLSRFCSNELDCAEVIYSGEPLRGDLPEIEGGRWQKMHSSSTGTLSLSLELNVKAADPSRPGTVCDVDPERRYVDCTFTSGY